jgi:hypothetical protein
MQGESKFRNFLLTIHSARGWIVSERSKKEVAMRTDEGGRF